MRLAYVVLSAVVLLVASTEAAIATSEAVTKKSFRAFDEEVREAAAKFAKKLSGDNDTWLKKAVSKQTNRFKARKTPTGPTYENYRHHPPKFEGMRS
ncbi:hypothetical protein PHYPSEUDO_012976 [Phytophthora pseudosyringae]|uniref:RxLR effector protein n=1 Tax=Phytophthora pseudosyringae TaxID=221518 RepID=A0A8T1W7J4_9STRA|nr:hypothetical protein PHYPSEUDO_012976 [Phytophthora pseudosyringae]